MADAPTPRDAPPTFADDILFQARLRPGQPAVILPDRLVTYAMIGEGILRVEERLRALALPPREVVGVALASPIRQLIFVAALFRLGVASVSAEAAESVIALRLPARVYFQDPGGALTPGLTRTTVDEGWFVGPRLTPQAARGFAGENDLCRIELTSGSTGSPKAVSTSVASFRRRLASQFAAESLGVRGRVLVLPRTAGGLGFRVAARVLATGGTVVSAESAREALQMAAAYRVDAIVASVQQARDLVREQRNAPTPCPSLGALLMTGALPTRALLSEARARLCSQTIVHYGATETGPIASTPADLLMEEEGATGYPLPGATIEIVDAEGRPAAAGTLGRVRVRTAAMGQAFPPGPEDAHPSLRGGWFYPGDRGRLTPDGMLVLEGRESEVINSGGVKRAPELIEEVVLRHPNVAEAAAFGAPGPDGVEEINLAVATRAPIAAEDLVAWCGARGVAVARVFAVDALPRTSMGKIRRDEVKKSLIG